MPSYVTATDGPVMNLSAPFPATTSYQPQVQDVSQYTVPSSQDFQINEFDPAPAVQYPIAPVAPEIQFDPFQDYQSTSLLEYLSSPNPSPALVRRITSGGMRGIHTHSWFDVRNLRSWTDFNVSTITSIPGLLPLLEVAIPALALPEPARPNLQPETEAALHDICNTHYAAKVNAALKVSQGTVHMSMQACKPIPGSKQPEFISNYPSDYEKTLSGDPRGRVVGLVKCYDQWNTGMRGESPPKQVLYLQGLAHLHRIMREHGCRYGFIITEIELLCVRCGGPSDAAAVDPTTVNAQTGVPIFGYLEVSAPIRLSTQGAAQNGSVQMTAGLALWYLHMLAKENPLPGMGSWRMDVGGPAALTRQNCLERDSWIPKPNLSEKREAKRVRGWVWPEEPLSKRECGRGKRSKASK